MGNCCSKRHRHLQLWCDFSQQHPSSTGSTQLQYNSQPTSCRLVLQASILPEQSTTLLLLAPAGSSVAVCHTLPRNPGLPPHQMLRSTMDEAPASCEPHTCHDACRLTPAHAHVQLVVVECNQMKLQRHATSKGRSFTITSNSTGCSQPASKVSCSDTGVPATAPIASQSAGSLLHKGSAVPPLPHACCAASCAHAGASPEVGRGAP
jgi:hypothetical protein